MESLAQMGVQLLLFTLGLEFSLSKLKAVRSVALAGGMIQITAFMILAGLLATAIGASVHEGVFIGALVRYTAWSTQFHAEKLLSRLPAGWERRHDIGHGALQEFCAATCSLT